MSREENAGWIENKGLRVCAKKRAESPNHGQPLAGHSSHGPFTSGLAHFGILVSFRHSVGWQFHCQIGPRNAVLFRGPDTEVSELAPLGAEGAPEIPFPGGGLLAKRTLHTGHHTIGAGYRSSSAWADLVARSCLQQTV